MSRHISLSICIVLVVVMAAFVDAVSRQKRQWGGDYDGGYGGYGGYGTYGGYENYGGYDNYGYDNYGGYNNYGGYDQWR